MLPQFPPKIDLANLPTEFRPLDRISQLLGGPRIWLKSDDLTGALASGNKIRKLEYLFAEAQAQSCDAIITCGGVQSNHCRATAAIAARLGITCELILRGPKGIAERSEPYSLEELFSEGYEANLLLDYLCGADVMIFSPGHYSRHLESEFSKRCQWYQSRGQKAFPVPTGGSNALGLWGYIEAAKELEQDFRREAIEPGLVVCASGSGGTQGGLTLGFHLLNSPVQVLGMAVCDSEAYFDDKIRDDVREWQASYLVADAPFADAPFADTIADTIAINTLDGYIGPGYAIGYPELFDCIHKLAKTEGVVLDPVYSGKAFYALASEIKKGRFEGITDIVFIHTGGIYGVFPYKAQFL